MVIEVDPRHEAPGAGAGLNVCIACSCRQCSAGAILRAGFHALHRSVAFHFLQRLVGWTRKRKRTMRSSWKRPAIDRAVSDENSFHDLVFWACSNRHGRKRSASRGIRNTGHIFSVARVFPDFHADVPYGAQANEHQDKIQEAPERMWVPMFNCPTRLHVLINHCLFVCFSACDRDNAGAGRGCSLFGRRQEVLSNRHGV